MPTRSGTVSASGGTALRSFSFPGPRRACRGGGARGPVAAGLVLGMLAGGCAPPLNELPAASGGAPELLAVFDMSRREPDLSPQPRRRFYLWRERHRIVYATRGAPTVRMWRRHVGDDISYLEAWPDRRIAVEYVPGDLRALGASPDWGDLQGLVERKLLGTALRLRDTGSDRGVRVARYSGSARGTDLEVTWIPSLRLAAELEERRDGVTTRLTLRQIYGLDDAPWRPPDLRAFRSVDFADLGDAPPGLVPRPAGPHGAHE